MTVFKRAGERPGNERSGAPYHKPTPLPQTRRPPKDGWGVILYHAPAIPFKRRRAPQHRTDATRGGITKSILKELFDGALHIPVEICPGDPEYRALSRKISAQKKYLSGRMGPEDIERFQELEDLHTQSNAYYAFDCFRCGFHLGICLLAE